MNPIVDTFLGGSLLLYPIIPLLHVHLLRDAKLLSNSDRKNLENKIANLSQTYGIGAKIKVIESPGWPSVAQALDTTFFPGKAAIVVDPFTIMSCSEGEKEFLIGREIAHFKHYDTLGMSVVSGCLGIAATRILKIMVPALSVFSPLLNSSPAAFLGSLVGLVAISFFSRECERRADLLGFKLCSDENKNAGAEFYSKMQKNAILYRNEKGLSYWTHLWRKIMISEEGNFRLDFMRPSFSTRIKRLKAEERDYVPSPKPSFLFKLF